MAEMVAKEAVTSLELSEDDELSLEMVKVQFDIQAVSILSKYCFAGLWAGRRLFESGGAVLRMLFINSFPFSCL